MPDRSAEEAKAYNIEKMGEALGSQFSALWQDLTYLHMAWKEYVTLFGTKRERLDILNKAAPGFFRLVQDELFAIVTLSIARLTDPTASMGQKGKENLTVKNFPGLIKDEETKELVGLFIDAAETACDFAREWRNKWIAHRDLKLALEDEPALLLPNVEIEKVNAALESLVDVMNEVEKHYCGSETDYKFAGRLGGASSLLYVLHSGNKERDARAERLQKGEYREEDLDPKDI
jgi:hypothetical protein